MNAKKWIRIFFGLGGISLLWLIVFNIILDSYSILRSDYSNLYREPNQNFIKMKYLLSKETNYDSFIFGSSRVGKINPDNFKNGIYYNMKYSEGVPREHLENIRILINNGYKIKNILIGLDDFSYQVNPDEHIGQHLRKPHYNADSANYSKEKFYFSYFFTIPSKEDSFRFFKQLIGVQYQTANFDIYKSGLPIVPETVENDIESNVDAHIKNKKFEKPTHYSGDRIEDTINEIKQIKMICDENQINLSIFINPIHKTTYLDTNFDNFQKFKYKLSEITDFIDFSGLNEITLNNYYYYETSHYRTIVGDMIAKRLQNEDINFGNLVSKENINEHLFNLHKQIETYKSLKLN